ncbi:hypothetical protein G6011_08906 [Alternaria panax]|uniref:Developmental regulatory protein wetA n=1 Tax=Alternaria panax TaxID=48097 RepID=A0AAD4IA41_9PLEO|nr:hypothetical protein G6011_08906 [Alternaria panax]
MSTRPISDKEVDVVDLDRLFEEYVQTDLLGHFSDCNPSQSSSDEPKHLFDSAASNESELFGSEPILDRETQAAWHKALAKYEQNPTPFRVEDSTSSFYLASSSSGNDSFSDSELLKFDDLLELERKQSRSISQPPTSRPHTSGRSAKKAVSVHNQLRHRGILKSSKRSHASAFTKMMQASQHHPLVGTTRTRKTENPENSLTRASSYGIASPPLSIKDSSNEFFTHGHHQYASNYSSLPNNRPGLPNYQLTPCASPAMGISSNTGSGFDNDRVLASCSSSTPSAALSALQTPPSSLQLSMTTWGPNTSPALDLGFSVPCDSINGAQNASWWDENVSTGHPPHSTSFNQGNSRSTNQNMGLEGLGISCESAPYVFGTMHNAYPASRNSAAFDMATYGAMYNTSSHQQQQHRHAQHQVAFISQSVSRSPSPRAEERFHRQSHASSHRSSQSSTRRKSSNSSQQFSRQTSTSGSGVGFVNFTPDDSRKILTGVAPSGSSKTKARREKEAADKRRKLSRAAMRAVIEAGGDIDSLRRLEREGVLVMED